MVDLRYLALTLIGVFLALAIGLTIGSTLGSPDRRDRIYEGLQEQFNLLRQQNQEVQEENDRVRRRLTSRDGALRELQPAALRNRLPASTVAVVLFGGIDERPFWGELVSALRAAGAEIGPVARVPDRLRDLSPEARSRLGKVWDPEGFTEQPEPYEAAGWLAGALARGGPAARITTLVRETGIEMRGDASRPLRRVLLLTTADETRAPSVTAGEIPELRFLDAALEEGLRVVAAEPEAAEPSVVDRLRREVATVDNVDTPAGQISVVLALAGADGRFGSKPGAGRPIPPLDQP